MKVTSLYALVEKTLDDTKADNIKAFNISKQSSIADWMIVASGTSSRHVKSIADKIAQNAKQAGADYLRLEGRESADWVLVDLGDIIVHVMQAKTREFYNLEKIWAFEAPQAAAL